MFEDLAGLEKGYAPALVRKPLGGRSLAMLKKGRREII
jgi:hypothetical protein